MSLKSRVVHDFPSRVESIACFIQHLYDIGIIIIEELKFNFIYEIISWIDFTYACECKWHFTFQTIFFKSIYYVIFSFSNLCLDIFEIF